MTIWSTGCIGVPSALKIMEKVAIFYLADDIGLTLETELLDPSP